MQGMYDDLLEGHFLFLSSYFISLQSIFTTQCAGHDVN